MSLETPHSPLSQEITSPTQSQTPPDQSIEQQIESRNIALQLEETLAIQAVSRMRVENRPAKTTSSYKGYQGEHLVFYNVLTLAMVQK